MKRGRRVLDTARRRHPRPHRARNARQPRSRNGARRGASSGPAEVRQCRPGEGGYARDLAMAAVGTTGAGQLVCRSYPPAASRVRPALGAHACPRHRRYSCRIRRGARRAPEPAALRARTRARRVLDEDRLDARRVPAHTRTDAWVPRRWRSIARATRSSAPAEGQRAWCLVSPHRPSSSTCSAPLPSSDVDSMRATTSRAPSVLPCSVLACGRNWAAIRPSSAHT